MRWNPPEGWMRIETIDAHTAGEPLRVTLQADCTNGKLMQYIARHAQVERESYVGHRARIEALMAARQVEGLCVFGDDVQVVAQQTP